MDKPSSESNPNQRSDRLNERLAELVTQLSTSRSIGALGLAHPALEPRVLIEASQSADGWNRIRLLYGDPFSADGPTVTVSSSYLPMDCVEQNLETLVEIESNRLFDHSGIDEPTPTQSVLSTSEVEIDGERIQLDVVATNSVSAASVVLPGSTDDEEPIALVLELTTRGVPMAELRLTRLSALEPFMQGRAELLASLSARPSEEADVPSGELAVRTMVELVVDQSIRSSADDESPRRPLTSPRAQRRIWFATWQAAVAFQVENWGIDEGVANDQVATLVNHISHLASSVDWFRRDAELRSAAIDECIAFVTQGAALPSRGAQEAWLRYWRPRRGAGMSLADVASRTAESGPDPLLQRWFDEWGRWRAQFGADDATP